MTVSSELFKRGIKHNLHVILGGAHVLLRWPDDVLHLFDQSERCSPEAASNGSRRLLSSATC
jgi:hypothetical protein